MSEYHVAPSGIAANDGSEAAPWPLQHALSGANGLIKAGDEIIAHKGEYAGAYKFDHKTPSGTVESRIVLRGEGHFETILRHSNAIDAEACLFLEGSESHGGEYWDIRDLHITGPLAAKRVSSEAGSFPMDVPRHQGISAQGAGQQFQYGPHGLRVINCLVENVVGNGIGFWQSFRDGLLYGNISMHNGWTGPDRTHGHGGYCQSTEGHQVRGNIFCRTSGGCLQTFGSSAALAHGMVVSDNINFDPNCTTKVGQRAFLLTGGIDIDGFDFQRNYCYVSIPLLGNGGDFVPETTFKDVRILNSWFHSARAWALRLTGTPVEFTGCRVIGSTTGFSPSAYPGNQYGKPAGVHTFVIPNEFEQGRAHVAVYNFDGSTSADLDLSGVLEAGQQYSVWDVQALLTGGPVAGGTYDGNPVTVPLNLTAVDPIRGLAASGHTPAEFNAFLVRAIDGGDIEPPPPPPSENKDTASITITVLAGDPAPTDLEARIAADPIEGQAPLSVRFDASQSIGAISRYDWDFGDGATASGAIVSHTYLSPGSYQAVLTVTG